MHSFIPQVHGFNWHTDRAIPFWSIWNLAYCSDSLPHQAYWAINYRLINTKLYSDNKSNIWHQHPSFLLLLLLLVTSPPTAASPPLLHICVTLYSTISSSSSSLSPSILIVVYIDFPVPYWYLVHCMIPVLYESCRSMVICIKIFSFICITFSALWQSIFGFLWPE